MASLGLVQMRMDVNWMDSELDDLCEPTSKELNGLPLYCSKPTSV